MGGSGLDRKGSGQSSSSGAKLAHSFRRHTLRWLQAHQRWVILTFRWSGTSSGGRLSFLGLSGVYCKQRCSWVTRSWLFNGCYQNHEDGSAVSNACAETSWMMQAGVGDAEVRSLGCFRLPLDAGMSGSNSG